MELRRRRLVVSKRSKRRMRMRMRMRTKKTIEL
jgi:hypothetical protein